MQKQGILRRLRWPLAAAVFAVLAVTTTGAIAGSGVGGIFNLGVANDVNGTTDLHGATAGPSLLINNTSGAAGAYAIAANGNSSAPAISGGNTAGPGFRGISTNFQGAIGASTNGTGAYGVSTNGIGVQGQTGSSSLPAVRAINTGGGPAGRFEVTSGTVTPFTVNSSTKVVDLNADQLDGLHANQLGRKAWSHFDFPVTPAFGTDVTTPITVTTTQAHELLDVNLDLYVYSTDTTAANYPCQPAFTIYVDGTLAGPGFAIPTMAVPPPMNPYIFGTASEAETVSVTPGVHTVQAIYLGDASAFGTPPSCDAGMQIGRGTLIAHSSLFLGDGSPATRPAPRVKAGDNKATK